MNKKLFASHLKKLYGKKLVVKDVSFAVKQGEIVALLGPNGAGKTTCFYMIVGLVRANHGKIVIGDKEISNLPINLRSKLGIGYLPQEASIFRSLTAEENILAILEIHMCNKKERLKRLDELLNEFSLTHIRKTMAISLSGGERRRVEIARLLASNPDFVLLDEPFAGVDPIAIHEVKDIILHLKTKGIGVLITDHNVRETLQIIDRAYIIHDGKILIEGKSADIINDQRAKEVYLGENFML